jgi:hypothetical protein
MNEKKPVQSWKEAYDNIQDDECKLGIACAVFIPLAIFLIISSFAGCHAACKIWGQVPPPQPPQKVDPIAQRIQAVKSSVYDTSTRDKLIGDLVEQSKDFKTEWSDTPPEEAPPAMDPAAADAADQPTGKKDTWQ